MTRFVVRNNFVGEFNNGGGFGSFGGVERADTIAIDGLLSHEFGRFAAEVFEEATLNDGVEILLGFAGFFGFFGKTLMFGNVAWQPVMSAM